MTHTRAIGVSRVTQRNIYDETQLVRIDLRCIHTHTPIYHLKKTQSLQVWVNAAAQIFNSVGIAFGSMICFASYNKFHNNILVDTVAVSLINACSCLLVGIFAFATIGNIAVEQNMTVPEVLSDGRFAYSAVYFSVYNNMTRRLVVFFYVLSRVTGMYIYDGLDNYRVTKYLHDAVPESYIMYTH